MTKNTHEKIGNKGSVASKTTGKNPAYSVPETLEWKPRKSGIVPILPDFYRDFTVELVKHTR